MTNDFYYCCGIDAIQGTITMRHENQRGDDFATATWRVHESLLLPPQLVNVRRYRGINADKMSAFIHQQDQIWGYDLLGLDPGGGGFAVRDKLREPEQNTGREKFMVTPIIASDDDLMAGAGTNKLLMLSSGDKRLKAVYPDITISPSFLPNRMHEMMRGALDRPDDEAANVQFPEEWEGWDPITRADPDQMRDALDRADGMAPHERARAEIDLALAQLGKVSRVMLADGRTVKVDRNNKYQFTSGYKKDAAYAVLYGYLTIRVWMEEIRIHGLQTPPRKSDITILVDDL